MAERRKINTKIRQRQIQRQRQRQEDEERLARQEEERITRQNAFRNDNRNLREIGGNPQRISNNEPIIPSAPPLSEIAQDLADERRTVIADYFGPNLPREVYEREGFPPLKENITVVADLNHANFIEHITADGDRKLYSARNFRLDKYDPENLLEAQDITDESTVDPDNIIKIQLEALRTGGKYRFIFKRPDITTRTSGHFCGFSKKNFLFHYQNTEYIKSLNGKN